MYKTEIRNIPNMYNILIELKLIISSLVNYYFCLFPITIPFAKHANIDDQA